jgi:uncharacterized protein (DUF1810 family)
MDPFNLDRFVVAQAQTYGRVSAELRAGRKRSHWMWFVFPQFRGLGASERSKYYAIQSRAEAEAYLAHPILGPRLVETTELVLAHAGRPIADIFGAPDDLKFRSSMTLFSAVAPPHSSFERALEVFFDDADRLTLRLLENERL